MPRAAQKSGVIDGIGFVPAQIPRNRNIDARPALEGVSGSTKAMSWNTEYTQLHISHEVLFPQINGSLRSESVV